MVAVANTSSEKESAPPLPVPVVVPNLVVDESGYQNAYGRNAFQEVQFEEPQEDRMPLWGRRRGEADPNVYGVLSISWLFIVLGYIIVCLTLSVLHFYLLVDAIFPCFPALALIGVLYRKCDTTPDSMACASILGMIGSSFTGFIVLVGAVCGVFDHLANPQSMIMIILFSMGSAFVMSCCCNIMMNRFSIEILNSNSSFIYGAVFGITYSFPFCVLLMMLSDMYIFFLPIPIIAILTIQLLHCAIGAVTTVSLTQFHYAHELQQDDQHREETQESVLLNLNNPCWIYLSTVLALTLGMFLIVMPCVMYENRYSLFSIVTPMFSFLLVGFVSGRYLILHGIHHRRVADACPCYVQM